MAAADPPPAPVTAELIAPSILSADFGRLGAQVDELLEAGCRAIHIDVMDGRFVPNLSMGFPIVAALRDRVHAVGGILDCHLMIEEPERYATRFVAEGADWVSVHVEATRHLHRTLGAIREAGGRAGAALNPGTPVGMLEPVAGDVDYAVCMTVDPGFGGQAFLEPASRKLAGLRALLGHGAGVEVDGGVTLDTAPRCRALGANLLVSGSGVFGADGPAAGYAALADQLREPKLTKIRRV